MKRSTFVWWWSVVFMFTGCAFASRPLLAFTFWLVAVLTAFGSAWMRADGS